MSNILICECLYPCDHIIFEYDEELNVFFCQIHLNKISFWQRLKYLFTGRSNEGAYREFIISSKHTNELEKAIKKLNQSKQ